MKSETEWEKWETLDNGAHFLQWKPVGFPVQEYICVDGGYLFDIDTGNAVGRCEKCAFKEKLHSIQFSAGAKTYPKNYYDQEALNQIGMDKEGLEEYKDTMEGLPLKWDKKTPYKKDKTGDYVKADNKDMQRIMYGGSRREKEAGR